jgi:ribosomal protein S18 acetylase RimI-like enzyme
MSEAEAELEVDETTTWPELAIGLYERLTGRGAEITYEFEEMEIAVPSKTGEDAEHAHWEIDGTLRITTNED